MGLNRSDYWPCDYLWIFHRSICWKLELYTSGENMTEFCVRHEVHDRDAAHFWFHDNGWTD